jgi:hypothetical protein
MTGVAVQLFHADFANRRKIGGEPFGMLRAKFRFQRNFGAEGGI